MSEVTYKSLMEDLEKAVSYRDGMHIEEGIAAADSATAQCLALVSETARNVFGRLASCRSGGPAIDRLIVSLCPRYGGDEVRAALVELHTRGLVEFYAEGSKVSRHGTWDGKVNEIMGGPPGSALWPLWGDLDAR